MLGPFLGRGFLKGQRLCADSQSELGLQPDRRLPHALFCFVSVGQDSGAGDARPTTLPKDLVCCGWWVMLVGRLFGNFWSEEGSFEKGPEVFVLTRAASVRLRG